MSIPTINKDDYKRYSKSQKTFYWIFVVVVWIVVVGAIAWKELF